MYFGKREKVCHVLGWLGWELNRPNLEMFSLYSIGDLDKLIDLIEYGVDAEVEFFLDHMRDKKSLVVDILNLSDDEVNDDNIKLVAVHDVQTLEIVYKFLGSVHAKL